MGQEEEVTREGEKKKEPIALKFAPFWKRIIAYLIDVLILRFLFVLIIYFIFGREIDQIVSQQKDFMETVKQLTKFFNQYIQLYIADFIIEASYFSLLWKGSGQTAGAGIMGIAVISIERKHLNLVQGILRYSLLSLAASLLYIPLVFIMNPVYRQRIHDYFTDSVAVEVPKIDRTRDESDS
jgi:uncharacterized RDD family membrane protein YckC